MKSSSKSVAVQDPARFPWIFFIVLAVVISIPFGFGKYFELNTKGPYDSGAYVYSAKHILDGAKMGSEEKVSARMGTLLVNMLGVGLFGFGELGPKLLQMLFQITALVFMFVALYRLWGKWPAAFSTFITAFYLSAPVIAKFGNVKEQYMIAFMIVGVSCYVFRQLGGFSEELFAAEELELTARLKELAAGQGREMVILRKHPLKTSGRKMELYGTWEMTWFFLTVLFARQRVLQNRQACHPWYDGRR